WYTVRLVRMGHKLTYILPFALILAGAIGNMLDCAFYGLLFSDSWFSTAEFLPEGGGYAPFLYGRVVDMLYFPLIETTYPQWVPFAGGQELVFFRPVFNVADSAITVGFIWFLIMQLLGAKTKAPAPAHDLD
ncbi:MAG: signal peptidase II, partial [Bacteroidales bacterium]|nr:signal peptidase II [Bacteroidales bacterium]